MNESNITLPVLSGDFFTYADRNDHYWSGKIISHKHLCKPAARDNNSVSLDCQNFSDLLKFYVLASSEIETSKNRNLLDHRRNEVCDFFKILRILGIASDCRLKFRFS